MSQARSFTIELTQVGTGKKATVKVNQAGFIPQYIFKFGNTTDTTKRVSANADGKITESLAIISRKNTLDSARSYLNNVGYISRPDNEQMIQSISAIDENNVAVVLTPNPTYSTRSVTITFTQKESGKILTLIVTQAAKPDDGVFKADPTALSFGAASDTKSSKITSTSKGQTVGWTVTNKSSMPSWLTISGEDTGTLSVTTKAYK